MGTTPRFSKLKTALKALLAAFAVLVICVCAVWLQMEGFFMKDLNGTAERIARSPHFKDGRAQNKEPFPATYDINASIEQGGEDFSLIKFSLAALFNSPKMRIPSVKSNLSQLPEASFVWFGHSSYLIKLGGKHILIDPVLQDNAAPVPFIVSALDGADIYAPDEIPSIDFLIITHSHYDHLSKKTIKALAPKVRQAIVPLGVGKYLAAWGVSERAISELDWDESAEFSGFAFHCLTARHYSNRGVFDKDKTLWAAFMLEFDGRRLFLGGDSGYGAHFMDFGARFGGADIAFLDNGQFNARWAAIHAFPHESLQIAQDLAAQRIVSVHNSKFRLAPHAWDAPLEQLFTLYTSGDYNFELLMPQIGQITPLWGEKFELKPWWRGES